MYVCPNYDVNGKTLEVKKEMCGRDADPVLCDELKRYIINMATYIYDNSTVRYESSICLKQLKSL